MQNKCVHCGKDFLAKHNKKYCDNKCQQSYQRSLSVAKWLAGEWDGTTKYGLSSSIRLYLLEQAGWKCSECGWDKVNPTTGVCPVQVDHVDGNWLNNRPENLTVLCPSCHSLTPTYGALNKGNGRTYRYH